MSKLFEPFSIQDLSLKNKIVMAPMCMYSAKDGVPNEFHHTHYVSRAVGGVGLILVEMTNIEADGRITNGCLGLWNDEQRDAFKPIVTESKKYDAKVGIQIAHAGRKAEDAVTPVSATDDAYSDKYRAPHQLTTEEAEEMVDKYKQAARRAVEAGFDTIEIHGAHGYLIHQFQSPISNNRDDKYGKDRSLFGVEVVKAVKSVMPTGMPLLFRISAYEYAEGGYDLDYGVELSKKYVAAGVDVMHVSAGGEGKPVNERFGRTYPGYMADFARGVKEGTGVPVIGVGILDSVDVADHVLNSGACDLIAIGRALLRDPYWVLNAEWEKDKDARSFIPKQYERGYY